MSHCSVFKFRGVHFEEAVALALIEKDAHIKSQMLTLLELALTRHVGAYT